jgi:hypothetical protein
MQLNEKQIVQRIKVQLREKSHGILLKNKRSACTQRPKGERLRTDLPPKLELIAPP